MKMFSVIKTIKKGITGATIAGASAAGVIEYIKDSEGITMAQLEQSIAIVVVSLAGFAFQALKNFLKNRNRL